MNPKSDHADSHPLRSSAYYETERIVSEYLLFHYGTAGDLIPAFKDVTPPPGSLNFPSRCVTETFEALRPGGRALDLGCAVGRATFEFARLGLDPIGIDSSRAFIAAAERLRVYGEISAFRNVEGEIQEPFVARRPDGIPNLDSIRFLQGDAMNLPEDLGAFDAVLMANLIDRLSDPMRCLERLPGLVKPCGQLVITSPYTWLEEFTPVGKWLGGKVIAGVPMRTLDGLRSALDASFDLIKTLNLPFLIREHDRKYQWSIAEASLWRRKAV